MGVKVESFMARHEVYMYLKVVRARQLVRGTYLNEHCLLASVGHQSNM